MSWSPILITGKPGSGKTTLIKRLVQHLKDEKSLQVCGFFTEEVRGANGVRIGFDIVTFDGKRQPLARSNWDLQGPSVGKYTVDLEAVDNVAVRSIEEINPVKSPEDSVILIIDEIGKMEMFSKTFSNRIFELLKNGNVKIVCTVALNLLDKMKNATNGKAKAFQVERPRADSLYEALLATLNEQLDMK